MAAAARLLTAAGLVLALGSLCLLAVAICTDYWYETDARRHRERCKSYAGNRNDPGYISISSPSLPLKMPRRIGAPARERRHLAAVPAAMESHCSRRFNSTVSGLWRKCHREGFDLETDKLIFKGTDRLTRPGTFCVVSMFSQVPGRLDSQPCSAL